jgi:transposase
MSTATVLERAGLGSVRKGRLLPLHPAGSKTVNEAVDLVENDEGGVVFLSGIAAWCWNANDTVGRRVGAVSLIEVGAANQLEVAAAFGVHDLTLRRWRDSWRRDGINGLVPEALGPRRASKLTDEVIADIVAMRDDGTSIADIATRVGISVRSVGSVVSKSSKQRSEPNESAVSKDSGSSLTPLAKPVSRDEERQAARFGEITEAPPVITQGASLPLAGTLVILPTLAATGLLDVFNTTYASSYAKTRAAFYGLRSLVLSIVFCALLGCSRAQAAGRLSPIDLGRLLGLDRGPETKTIRRRTEELATLRLSDKLGIALANHHLEALGNDDGGVFYLDGHVRAYHGTARLPKVHVARLERAMPGEEDAWLCDAQGAGILVWSSLPGSGLTTELRRAMDEIRALVGDDKRPMILFDRGGWSPKTFCEIVQAGFDLCTYRKAPLPREPRSTFSEMTFTDDLGREQNYWLADRRVRIPFKEKTKAKYFSCRQIARLDPETGHQTQVLTTRYDDEPTVIAQLMFSRWRQENFFRYMRAHYDLDALDSYAKIPDDLERLVANPKRKAADKKVTQAKALLAKAEQTEGRASLDGQRQKQVPVLTSAFDDAHKELERLQANAKALPAKIRLGDVYPDAQRTNVERKRIFDFIRMATYNAESALARLLEPHYSRAEDEARVLLREIFSRSGDIVIEGNTLHVRIDPLSAPHRTRALAGLCNELTETKTIYPGTDLVMVYSTKDHVSD